MYYNAKTFCDDTRFAVSPLAKSSKVHDIEGELWRQV